MIDANNLKVGQRIIHKLSGGEYEVRSIDDRFLKVLEVENQLPKRHWKELTYRIADCYNDFNVVRNRTTL